MDEKGLRVEQGNKEPGLFSVFSWSEPAWFKAFKALLHGLVDFDSGRETPNTHYAL